VGGFYAIPEPWVEKLIEKEDCYQKKKLKEEEAEKKENGGNADHQELLHQEQQGLEGQQEDAKEPGGVMESVDRALVKKFEAVGRMGGAWKRYGSWLLDEVQLD